MNHQFPLLFSLLSSVFFAFLFCVIAFRVQVDDGIDDEKARLTQLNQQFLVLFDRSWKKEKSQSHFAMR